MEPESGMHTTPGRAKGGALGQPTEGARGSWRSWVPRWGWQVRRKQGVGPGQSPRRGQKIPGELLGVGLAAKVMGAGLVPGSSGGGPAALEVGSEQSRLVQWAGGRDLAAGPRFAPPAGEA